MMRRASRGSVVLDRSTWRFLFWEGGKRKSKTIGTKQDFPTKAAAWFAAKPFRDELERRPSISVSEVVTVNDLIEFYRKEKMPDRYDTRRGYECWLRNYVIPRWGNSPITELRARPVELWLESLPLAPKSRSHLRGMVHILWDFALWSERIPMQPNPVKLVRVKDASKRVHVPRSLTVEEFRQLIEHLSGPFRVIALACVCFGLRISEALALKWADVDWLNATLHIQRSVVRSRVGNVKTVYSGRKMVIDAGMLDILKAWKQAAPFSANDDWMFASPAKLGRQPWSYDPVLRSFLSAAKDAGIGHIGTHSLRHSYRSWLDSIGAPAGVTQKLMRHADIRTTYNIYGDAATADMAQAHGKIVSLALNGSQTDRKAS